MYRDLLPACTAQCLHELFDFPDIEIVACFDDYSFKMGELREDVSQRWQAFHQDTYGDLVCYEQQEMSDVYRAC